MGKLPNAEYFCIQKQIGWFGWNINLKARSSSGPSVKILLTLYTERYTTIVIPTQTMFVGLYCFHVVRPSVRPFVRPSVTFCFFPNILKRHRWKFIKLCRHIDIDKMHVYNKRLRVGANSVGVIALCSS